VTEHTVVTVRIAGEEYAIRAQATPEYARECAEFVDHTITEIMKGALVHSHKAAILAALAITDQLFQGRREAENVRVEFARRADKLASEVEARLEPADLAARS
jgi:cell division protein ZapA (FtsZ GTPase activity inhibitor)